MRYSSPVWPKELSSIVYEIHHTGTYIQHVRISVTTIVESIWNFFLNCLKKNYCRISTCVFVIVILHTKKLMLAIECILKLWKVLD